MSMPNMSLISKVIQKDELAKEIRNYYISKRAPLRPKRVE